jgi:hypothetical protein
MPRNKLLLLKPGFMDQALGPYYCPACATIEGLLGFYPQLRDVLDVRYLDFPRPRAEVIAEIGTENQGLPALVLYAPVPADALRDLDVREWNGRRFLKGPADIGRYLARTTGIDEPH